MKITIIEFQIIQSLVILIFLVFVSDLRKKNLTKSLINPILLQIMKAVYVIPLGLFLLAVITMNSVLFKDWIALILTITGLIIVVIAKITLGTNHSWTGYGAFPKSFSASGIYSLIRHPMYLGIYLCIIGMILFIFRHLSLPLFIVDIIGSGYIFFILYTSAKKETEHLISIFGNTFEKYRDDVPAYLPKFYRKGVNLNNQYDKLP